MMEPQYRRPGTPHQWQQPRPQPHPQVMMTSMSHKSGPGAVEHIVHLTATLLTCGLWLPVWIIRSASARRNTTHYYHQ